MRLTAPFVGLLLSSLCFSQETGQDFQDSYKMKPFRQLEERIGGNWVAHWNAATNTPEAIYGTGMPLPDWRGSSLEEARRQADRVLEEYRDLLQLGASDFREVIGAQMGNVWSFTYDQSFHTVPCIGGRADIRIHKRGVVSLLGSTAWPIAASFDTTPAIDEVFATAQAWLKVGVPTGVPQPGKPRAPRLCIWGDVHRSQMEPVHLAWEIPVSNVDRDGVGPIGRYYVDAKTGDVLRYETDKHECGFAGCKNPHHGANRLEVLAPPAQPLPPVPTTVTVMAFLRTGPAATSPLLNVPLPGLVVNVPGIGARTTDANGQFIIDIAAPVTISLTALDGRHHAAIAGSNPPSASVNVTPGVDATLQILSAVATQEQVAHTNCSWWVDKANEWARVIVGPTGAPSMNILDSVGVNVNVAGNCNAFYNGASVNFYPTAGSCNNTAFGPIIVHEWGHGLDDRFGGISNSLPDGLSEAWGDVVGLYLTDQPILGQGFFTSGGAVRNGVNSTLYPSSSTDVHVCGQSWMGFAWQFRENMRTAFGTPTAVAVSEDIVVGSIVANAATQPNAMIQVFIADDNDANLLNGVPHYAQLSAAATAKTIPFPQIQPTAITHTPINSNTNRLTPSLVNCTVAAQNGGTISQVRLVFTSNGSAPQTRVLVPNGLTNGYRGMLPGIASGLVTYHLEATNTIAPNGRLPATGEFNYTVLPPVSGAFTGFYLENFEGTGAGWTHVRVSGTATEDWQIGLPNGKTGTGGLTGFNVPWADPGSGVSTRVYGNDLGASTANGAYPNSMNYYLLSPAINCTGRTGCTLRFRRWLTVEEGQYDQATISVNGLQVWVNPSVGHTIDTSWQTIELPIPMADNNPSVRIEWRLVSDGGLVLGGWNIDDVEVGTKTVTPLNAEWRMLPEQVGSGLPMTMSVQTQGPQPFIIAIGDTTGPTLIPGIPPLLVGGSTFSLNGFSDAAGQFSFGFNAPFGAPPIGILWFSQVLTLNSVGGFVTSNQHLNLFTP